MALRLTISKTNLAKLRSRVGMVFQHFGLFPHLSIIDNLTLAQIKVLNRDKESSRKQGLKLLERVGLAAHAEKYPAQLSGGLSSSVSRSRARCAWIRSRCCSMSQLQR